MIEKKERLIHLSQRQLTQIETDLRTKGINFSTASKALLKKDIIDINISIVLTLILNREYYLEKYMVFMDYTDVPYQLLKKILLPKS